MWTPASLRGISTQASCKKPCWTPRQHDTISKTERVYVSQTSRGICKSKQVAKNTERQPFCSVLLHSCDSSTLAVKAVQTAAQPRLVIQGASSAVSSQPSRISPEPFTITKHQTAACLGLPQPPQRVFVLRSAARAGGRGW